MSFLRRKPTDEHRPSRFGRARPRRRRRAAGRRQGPPDPEAPGGRGSKRGPVAPPPKTQREAMKRSKVAGQVDDQGRAAGRRPDQPRADDGRRRAVPAPPGPRQGRGPTSGTWWTPAATSPGILLPIALLSFVILLIPVPVVQAYGPLVLLVAIVAAIIDSIIFGRQIVQEGARRSSRTATAPGSRPRAAPSGFYAFNRACLIRRWRVPRPRVDRRGADDRLTRAAPVSDDSSGRPRPTRDAVICAGSSTPTAG